MQLRKPKILLLGKLPPPFMGPAIATQHLLGSTLRERYELLHVNTTTHPSLDAMGRWSTGKLRRLLGVYARLALVLASEKPEVVLVPFSQATLGFVKDSGFILLSRLFGRTTLVQVRGSNLDNWLADASPLTRWYVGRVLRTAQGGVVLGRNLRYLFAPYYPADRIFVVPNGADYRIPKVERPEANAPVRVLYLANLQPSKGIEDVVLAALRLMEDGVSGFVLDVVGEWRDDATRTRCESLVRDHRLPVTFHGPAYHREKFARMARADVFVFTPREPEGLPWVIVEALASGLPVISTDRGAIVECVRHGENGFIVDVHDPDQIAARLLELIESRTLREAFGATSRRLYDEHFTSERMVQRLCDVIELMRPGGRPHVPLSPVLTAEHSF